jgi:hypothetical protein
MTISKTKKVTGDKTPSLLKETLDLPFAKVTFKGLQVTYTKKDKRGKLTKSVLQKTYAENAISVVYGRLRGDDGRYLLRLMCKIEQDKIVEDMNVLIASLDAKKSAPETAKKSA